MSPDHLGSPRVVTDNAGAVVWNSKGEPFGATAPTGSFALNLRHPGQYYDAETGWFFNNTRYYDPALGQYISSDPIRLDGGINTYAYVEGNPLSYSDPLGLEIQCTCGVGCKSMEREAYSPLSKEEKAYDPGDEAGRYNVCNQNSSCKKSDFLMKTCKAYVRFACSGSGGAACCEEDFKSCMLKASQDDVLDEIKARECLVTRQSCTFRAGKGK